MKKKSLALALSLCLLLALCLLFASCTAEEIVKVKISMEANDGSQTTVVEVDSKETYPLPVPERAGYTFEGWYASADFSGPALTEISPTADISVYAKWNKLYRLSLEIGGGQLSQTSLELSAGAKLADAIASLVPTKTDCRFGMWLLDGEPLADGALMPAEDITLTAKYQAKYSVEIYTQNKTLDGYEKVGDALIDYAYVGESFTSKQTIEGFKEVDAPESVTTLVISDQPAQNVFRHYFDRANYTLTFVSNFPDGSQNQIKTENLIYGIEAPLPYVTFEMDGYYLEGWSQVAGGEMIYYSHVMDSRLFNEKAHAVETLTPDQNITLYAVWSKGYTDLFGGEDVIYVSAGEEETVYLLRGNVFFKGVIEKNRDLIFYDSNDDILSEGQINSDGQTFLYLNQSRSEVIATLYRMGKDKGLDENTKIYFNSANGITYSVKGEDGITTDSNGEYFFDGDNYMVATFKDGELAGKTLTLIVGNITLNNTTTPAFQVRNETEYALGNIVFYSIKDNAIVLTTDSEDNPIGDVTLNGFGIAAYNNAGSTVNYYYTYDEDTKIITLMSSQGTVAGTLRLMETNGVLGYMLYDETKDVSYTLADGSVLTLDGMQSATYEVGGKTVTGFYTEKKSAFGGTIFTFDAQDVTYKFMITSKTEEVLIDAENPESGTEAKTVTTVERKDPLYSEYYYKDANGTYYAPLFVFEGTDKTTVTVYGYTPAKTFLKMATGSLSYNAATQTYTFTATERFDAPDVFDTPVDFATVKSCVLMLDETATAYSINFWLSYTDEEQTTDNAVVYTAKDGATVTLTAGLAISRIGDRIEVGTYSTSGDTITVTFPEREATIKLDEEEKTFSYVTLPTTVYEVGKNGAIMQDHYLTIVSKDDITYTIITTDDEGQHAAKYAGMLYNTSKTSLTGFTIYRFISNDKKDGSDEPLYTLDFIQISASTQNYFFVYDEAYAGTYQSKNGVLKLDGFGYAATYGDESGLNVIGMYQKAEADVQITASGETYYFLLDGSTCALRGGEYGKAYLIMDNQAFWGKYVSLDGLGGATVFTVEVVDGESQKVDLDANATYTLDGDDVTLTYRDGNETHTLTCKMGIQKSGSNTFNALNVKHEEVVTSYVNEKDWSVLVLNSDGTASKYMKDGKVETGSFSLVTDSLLYYVNSTSTDAYIYVYDREAGTATPQDYDVCAYYTKDLESLLFSKYGFAIFNNDTRYYYTVVDGNVTIYHLEPENPAASKYGYVAESFGQFSDTKVYNDKTYYKNDGYAISFVRAADTADKFPVLVSAQDMLYAPTETLIFTPTGSEEFSVTGSVTVNGQNYTCTVVRELDDEGAPRMYIRIGAFYFDITINYQSDGSGSETSSTYEVTGLSYKNAMMAYNYLYYYYYIYSMMGSTYASQFTNSFGTLEIRSDYDEEGNETDEYMNGSFGPDSGFLDANGNLIATVDHAQLTPLGNSYYKATFVGEDGYTYSLYFTYTMFSVFQMYGYRVYALVREETVDANDGYQITVGRVIASDASTSTGAYFSFQLAKDGEPIDSSNVMLNDGKLFYIVRDKDDNGTILSTTYYELTLTEKSSGIVEEGEEQEDEKNKPLPVYESAKVTPIDAVTYMTTDGESYVDVLPENKILLMSLEGKSVLIMECDYDETTSTYTLTTSDDAVYTVTVKDNVATITLVPAEPSEEN